MIFRRTPWASTKLAVRGLKFKCCSPTVKPSHFGKVQAFPNLCRTCFEKPSQPLLKHGTKGPTQGRKKTFVPVPSLNTTTASLSLPLTEILTVKKSNFRPLGSNLSLIEFWPHWEDTNSHHHCNFIAPIWSFPLSSDIVKPFIAKPGARSSTNCISSPRDEIGLSLKLLDTADCYLYPTHTYHVCSMHKSLVGTNEILQLMLTYTHPNSMLFGEVLGSTIRCINYCNGNLSPFQWGIDASTNGGCSFPCQAVFCSSVAIDWKIWRAAAHTTVAQKHLWHLSFHGPSTARGPPNPLVSWPSKSSSVPKIGQRNPLPIENDKTKSRETIL